MSCMDAIIDVEVENHGSIILVRPITATAKVWCQDHIETEVPTWAGAYPVEPRYLEQLVGGLVADGFTVGERS